MPKLLATLRNAAHNFPNLAAAEYKRRKLSYAELVDSLGVLSGQIGTLTGARVLIMLPDSLAGYLLYLHAFLAEATIIPQTIQSDTSYVEQICERVRPHLVITSRAMYGKHARVLREHRCLIVDDDGGSSRLGFRYEFVHPSDEKAEVSWHRVDQHADEIRVVMFTSGSTGTPKGVCLSESNIIAAASMMVDFLSLEPSRKSLLTVPLYDYYGFIQIFGHILGISGIVLGESIMFPASLFKAIRARDVTDLVAVPYSLRRMGRMLAERRDDTLKYLRYATSSSDALSEDILVQLFALNPDLTIFDVYGLTEAGRACYREIHSSSPSSKSIGRPSPGVEIRIDHRADEPDNVGEIIIKGPNVMKGYLSDICDDQICVEPIDEVRTGDLGYWDANGEITLVGRRDHLININGTKVHPAEIESCALQIPHVADARARALTDASGQTSIHLDVVFSSFSYSVQELQKFLRARLRPILVPTVIDVVNTIGRTELGSKIIRSG